MSPVILVFPLKKLNRCNSIRHSPNGYTKGINTTAKIISIVVFPSHAIHTDDFAVLLRKESSGDHINNHINGIIRLNPALYHAQAATCYAHAKNDFKMALRSSQKW